MTKVRQALIAAGGKGSRVSSEVNPNGSKVLIEFKGKTLFEYLLDSLIAGGVKEFIISTGYHTDKKIREIVKLKKIKALVIPISECGSFRMIPFYLQDILDERFLFICGHQPLDSQFVQEVIEASKGSKYVASSYKGDLYRLERVKDMKILSNGENGQTKLESTEFDENKLQMRFFIDSPYVLTKEIVLEFMDNASGEYSHYILKHWQDGESLTVVKSPTPPEFDYDEEYERTIKNLSDES